MTKPTWVFVAGTYRSASTTQYLIARDIVEETHSGMGLGYHTETKLVEHDIARSGRYVVCKVFEYLPDGFRGEPSRGKMFLEQGRLRALCTIRDPRDIIVSMKTRAERQGKVRSVDGQMTRNTWNFRRTATVSFPRWLGQLERWIDLGTDLAYFSRFEDFTQNLFREVKQVAEFLDIKLSKDLAHDIAKRYTIQAQAMRKRQKRKAQEKEDPWLPSIPGVVFGAGGLWRTWLSAPEVKMVEESNKKFMERFGYL